jgi:hypothetical protein
MLPFLSCIFTKPFAYSVIFRLGAEEDEEEVAGFDADELPDVDVLEDDGLDDDVPDDVVREEPLSERSDDELELLDRSSSRPRLRESRRSLLPRSPSRPRSPNRRCHSSRRSSRLLSERPLRSELCASPGSAIMLPNAAIAMSTMKANRICRQRSFILG